MSKLNRPDEFVDVEHEAQWAREDANFRTLTCYSAVAMRAHGRPIRSIGMSIVEERHHMEVRLLCGCLVGAHVQPDVCYEWQDSGQCCEAHASSPGDATLLEWRHRADAKAKGGV
jgi:hypothetical protein